MERRWNGRTWAALDNLLRRFIGLIFLIFSR